MPSPISAFIITKNEEPRLARTIAALQPWVDEIVVVDSGSTDGTVELARSMGARVFYREWTGYGGQKRFAERQCQNDWVLNIDADEVVTQALAEEITGLFGGRTAPEPGAYRLKILTVYPGDEKPRPFANDYNVVRLYHRAAGSYRDHPVFDRVVLKDTVPRQLQQPVFHYSYMSFAHIIDKTNQFSSFRSRNSASRAPSYLRARLSIEFPMNFIKFYFFRRHVTGGWKGFYFALSHAFMRTTRIAKMLEGAATPRPVEAPARMPQWEPARRTELN